jgi:predicted nucleotidyltransferase
MREPSSNFAEVRFIDGDEVIRKLRDAVTEAKARRPEIAQVFLFGSFVAGNWTADSDADLIVVVRKEFPDVLSRSPYQVFTDAIPTDSLVYSESEFARLANDPASFLAQNLLTAIEL